MVGITYQLTSRIIFKEELTQAFTPLGINTIEGLTVFNNGFTDSKKSEEEINKKIKGVSVLGFDTNLITAL